MNNINLFIYELEKYLIVIVGLIFAIIEIKMYFKFIPMGKKILFASIGLYWAILNILFIIDSLTAWNFIDRYLFTRAGILFTLSVLCGQSLNKWRTLNK